MLNPIQTANEFIEQLEWAPTIESDFWEWLNEYDPKGRKVIHWVAQAAVVILRQKGLIKGETKHE